MQTDSQSIRKSANHSDRQPINQTACQSITIRQSANQSDNRPTIRRYVQTYTLCKRPLRRVSASWPWIVQLHDCRMAHILPNEHIVRQLHVHCNTSLHYCRNHDKIKTVWQYLHDHYVCNTSVSVIKSTTGIYIFIARIPMEQETFYMKSNTYS